MKSIITFLCMCLATLSFGQIVNIPDSNFKNALLNHDPVIDTNGDGEIQVSEAEAFNGMVNVSGQNISDLTGIQAFINITGLWCSSNNLEQLDISQNTALTVLSCEGNWNITQLDFSQNLALTELRCSGTSITQLDVSHNTSLIDLRCNGIIGLNQLDVSQNVLLETLQSDNTNLTQLDISQNLALKNLWVRNNNLTELDISQNIAIISLLCSGNSLVELDLSYHTDLAYLWCTDNLLESLNIANSNNENLELNTINNPNLNCIQVDADIVGNIPEHWEYDEGVEFSEDCFLSINESFNGVTTIYPNPTADTLYIQLAIPTDTIIYRVYSSMGKLVQEGFGNQISLQDIPSGIYYAIINIGDSISTHKIIKK